MYFRFSFNEVKYFLLFISLLEVYVSERRGERLCLSMEREGEGRPAEIVTAHFRAAVYLFFCEWHVVTVIACVTVRWFCAMAARCI